jgi:HPt (histidine-containing phosphotransfer) domain-containing protein
MDIKNLAEELGLEENDVLRFVRTFIETTEQDLLPLAQAIADQDADQVKKLAHHIKGAASNLELTDIADAARTIEGKGRSNSLEDTEPQIAAIRSGLDSIRADLISKD